MKNNYIYLSIISIGMALGCAFPAYSTEIGLREGLELGLSKQLVTSSKKILPLISKHQGLIKGTGLAYILYRLWKYTKGQPSAVMQEIQFANSLFDPQDAFLLRYGGPVSFLPLAWITASHIFNKKLFSYSVKYRESESAPWEILTDVDEYTSFGAKCVKAIFYFHALCQLGFTCSRVYMNTQRGIAHALAARNVEDLQRYQQGLLGLKPNMLPLLEAAIDNGNEEDAKALFKLKNLITMRNQMSFIERAQQKLQEDPENPQRQGILKLFKDKQGKAAKAVAQYLGGRIGHIKLPLDARLHIGSMLTGADLTIKKAPN